jgi:hypothetical protein
VSGEKLEWVIDEVMEGHKVRLKKKSKMILMDWRKWNGFKKEKEGVVIINSNKCCEKEIELFEWYEIG